MKFHRFPKPFSALGICLLAGGATHAQAQLQTAGNLLVNLDFTSAPAGQLPYIANPGLLGGGFEATSGGDTIPVIKNAPSTSLKALYLDGGDQMTSVDAQGGNRLDAPAPLSGLQPTRSVEVWVWNDAPIEEETVLSWGKRGGPDSTNFACNYGWNGTWGALGQWGGADMQYITQPVPGRWHQITWVHTGAVDNGVDPLDTTLIYVDGVLDNTETIQQNTHPGAILLGSQTEGDGVTPTPGLRGSLYIGRVRIQDGALTGTQVANNYAFETGTFATPSPTAMTQGPMHRWSFSETAGNVISDSVGYRKGYIRGTGAVWNAGQVELPGGASATAAYVDLPNYLVSDRAPELGGSGELTIEGWVTQNASTGWARIVDFGSSVDAEVTGPGGGGEGFDYLMLSAEIGTDTFSSRLELRNHGAVGNGPLGAGGPDITRTVDHAILGPGVTRHFTIVWKEGVGVYTYENGEPIREIRPDGIKMVNINDVNNWIGRSNWTGDANLNGTVDEIRIYDRILTPAEVAKNDLDGPDATLPPPPDTDSDTLPDWFERKYATVLDYTVGGQAASDPDADGLTNLQELQNDTNPASDDTDGDGLKDGAELTAGSNPQVTDTDGDGLSDGVEVNTYGTSPINTDSDGDGYSDGAEVAGSSNPTDSNSIPVIFLATRYSFSNAAGSALPGDVVTDTVSGLNGYVRGEGASWDGAGLTLSGGTSDVAPYVDLPNHLVSRFSRNKGGRGAVSFEGWITVPSAGFNWQRVFDFGSTYPGNNHGEIFNVGRTFGGDNRGMDYLFYSAARGTDTNLRRIDWTNDDFVGGTGNSGGSDFNASAGTLDTSYHFVVVADEVVGKVTCYENGVEVASFNSALKLDAINDVNCWLGRSAWNGDSNFGGTYDEFRIYAGAMSPADVVKSMNKGPNTLPTGTNAGTDITTLKVTDASGWPAWWVDRNPGLPAPGSDADGDGLTALAELGRGSDPTKADTDGDGLSDAVESGSAVYVGPADTGTSPTLADTDRDGLNDAAEVAATTDPFDVDSDDDLALDGADAAPLNADAVAVTPAHQWTFDDLPEGPITAGTASADAVAGAGFEAIIQGDGANALAGGSVGLPGGANNDTTAYIDLPNGLISSQPRVTLVGWVTLQGNTGNWSRIVDFGDSNGAEVPPAGIGNGNDYLFYAAQRGADQNLQRVALKDSTGGETFVDTSIAANLGQEIFFAISVDSSAENASLYTFFQDGIIYAGNYGSYWALSQIHDVNNWLGRSQYAGDATLQGDFREFRIYNGVLNEATLNALYAAGPDGGTLEITAINLITSPGGAELDITWTSRAGAVYDIEASGDLNSWTVLYPDVPGAGTTTTQTVPVDPGRRYFRVRRK